MDSSFDITLIASPAQFLPLERKLTSSRLCKKTSLTDERLSTASKLSSSLAEIRFFSPICASKVIK